MTNPASRWVAADYAANAGFVPALGAPVLDLLAPRAGERILDLGCGDGVLTRRIVAAGADVVGVDASDTLIAAARDAGIEARLMDGERLALDAEFDAAFSNAALHWMLDAAAVAAGVFRALKPNARLVGEMGGYGNIATLRAALYAELEARGHALPDGAPQWYPTPEAFAALPAGAGAVTARPPPPALVGPVTAGAVKSMSCCGPSTPTARRIVASRSRTAGTACAVAADCAEAVRIVSIASSSFLTPSTRFLRSSARRSISVFTATSASATDLNPRPCSRTDQVLFGSNS